MIEFILENLYSIIANYPLDRLKELYNQYNNQRILLLTTEQFVKAPQFKKEFCDIDININKLDILSVDNEAIEPSKTVDEIFEALNPVLDSMIITDDVHTKEVIIRSIASQYLTKRQLTISLFDLLESQRRNTDDILRRLDEVDRKALLITDSIEQKNALRLKAIRNGIGWKMELMVKNLTSGLIHIVTQKGPQFTREEEEKYGKYLFRELLSREVENKFPGIEYDFAHQKVEVMIPNPNGGICPIYEQYGVFEYMNFVKIQAHSNMDDIMKYSTLIPDDFLVSLIALLHALDKSLLFSAIQMGADKMLMFSKLTDPEGTIESFKQEFKMISQQINELWDML